MSQGKNRTGPTAKIAAGMRVQEILVAAAAKNVTIVTGADPGVGIGGWTTGGGHGPLTSLFGMGADQVLSMEVVTADGSLLEIDQYQHADLFWAMRGVSHTHKLSGELLLNILGRRFHLRRNPIRYCSCSSTLRTFGLSVQLQHDG